MQQEGSIVAPNLGTYLAPFPEDRKLPEDQQRGFICTFKSALEDMQYADALKKLNSATVTGVAYIDGLCDLMMPRIVGLQGCPGEPDAPIADRLRLLTTATLMDMADWIVSDGMEAEYRRKKSVRHSRFDTGSSAATAKE